MPTPPSRRPASPLRVERLEDRTVPAFSPFQLNGGQSIAVGDVFPEIGGGVQNEYILGNGPGQLPLVRVFDLAGNLEAEFLAYESTFTGGVNVAVGNIVQDAPLVAGTDFDEIVTGTGFGGGAVVKVFNPNNRTAVRQFFAAERTFRGGTNVAVGNVNSLTATDEIVTGAGFGGGPVVRVFNGDGSAFSSFFAYESTFRNGVNVAAGDILTNTFSGGNAGDEIATGPGDGGSPLLKVFSGTGTQLRAFFAFDPAARNGLSVTVGNTEQRLGEEVFAVEQFTSFTVQPVFRSFNAQDAGQIESEFTPFPAGYSRYYNMAVGDVDPFNTTGFNNAADWVGVAAEVQTNQTPRVQFGLTGSAAGNNGP